ncbi:replication-relaxation family protein [Desertibacillus haloalkaliphilus]|uniref:replication-relaxation family protein n=1 Tax=Desertibacillus haloalkaliphilus TaxID=1328930 RepID=UPI001C26B282|nr:replication-relaxation family protein [Desertibacillus haloalkaliphilus]MBU8908066.1 replication-relaxation family protein [Desertibacillus haloalkaliphilus]
MKRFKLSIANNRRGVWLSALEIDLIKILLNNRFLTTKQIIYFLVQCGNNFNENSIRNRLFKLESIGFIDSYEYVLGNDGFIFKYYQVTKKCVDCLVEEGLILDSFSSYKAISMGANSITKYIEHTFSINEIVIRTLVTNRLENDDGTLGYKVESLSPHKYVYWDNKNPSSRLIVPDWIFKKENRFVNVEVDSGSEDIKELELKVLAYIKLLDQRPNENHTVLIALMDDSIPTRSYRMNRNKRISNIRDSLNKLDKLRRSHLEVYVVQLERAHRLVDQLLYDSDSIKYDKSYLKNEIKKIVEAVSQNDHFHFDFRLWGGSDEYIDKLNHHLSPDGIVEVVEPRTGQSEKWVLLMMREGHNMSLEKLSFLHKQMVTGSYPFLVDRLLCIYETPGELSSDNIGKTFKGVLFSDYKNLDTFFEEPKFYKSTSPFRKGVVDIDFNE